MALAQFDYYTIEAYHKILSNLSNAKSVWGVSSPQYRESQAVAAEYHRLLQIDGHDEAQVSTTNVSGAMQEATMTTKLAFRSRVKGQDE